MDENKRLIELLSKKESDLAYNELRELCRRLENKTSFMQLYLRGLQKQMELDEKE